MVSRVASQLKTKTDFNLETMYPTYNIKRKNQVISQFQIMESRLLDLAITSYHTGLVIVMSYCHIDQAMTTYHTDQVLTIFHTDQVMTIFHTDQAINVFQNDKIRNMILLSI